MTTLEEVKALSKTKPLSDDIIKIALAWAKDEVTTADIARALNVKSSNVYATLALALKQHYAKNN
jgi:Mn-dependent DtxR family transcriptional regulator